MKKYNIIIITIILMLSFQTFAQLENQNIRHGNKKYNQKKFSEAEAKYQLAKNINQNSVEATYNLANAQYMQKNYNGAIKTYQNTLNLTKNNDTLAKIYHNLGNAYTKSAEDTLLKQKIPEAIKILQKAIKNYKSAIKLNPENKKTKFNYIVTKKILDQLQQQQNKNNQDKNNKNKNNQDQNNQDQNNQNQDQNNQNQNNQNNDTDKDGIPDNIEKQNNKKNNPQPEKNPQDTDKDGTPDYQDTDSDNDGIPDQEEAGQNPEKPKDTDKDGTPDYRDTDSNNDGETDQQENAYAIPKDEINRMLNAIEDADLKTYEKAKNNIQKNVKSKSKNW